MTIGVGIDITQNFWYTGLMLEKDEGHPTTHKATRDKKTKTKIIRQLAEKRRDYESRK